jgi:hypothetical protein
MSAQGTRGTIRREISRVIRNRSPAPSRARGAKVLLSKMGQERRAVPRGVRFGASAAGVHGSPVRSSM